jgi:hypothetical protein
MRQASEVDMQLMMNRGQRKYRNAQRSCVRTRTKPVFWQIATVKPRTIPISGIVGSPCCMFWV